VTTVRRGYRERISRGDRANADGTVTLRNGIVVQVMRRDTPMPDTPRDLGWHIDTSRTQFNRGWDELKDDERAEVRAQYGDEPVLEHMYFRRGWSHG
jgi:hypothetical protein